MLIKPAVELTKGLKGSNSTPRWTFLHPKQMEVFKSPARFRVCVAGRRFGKTELAKSELITEASKGNRLVWYVAPTTPMARQLMWKVLLDSIPRQWLARKPHETTMMIWLKNGSQICLKGADNPDSLRGVGLDFVVLDEYQDMKEGLWQKVIRPTLSDKRGRALIIGTARSYNQLYAAYMKGQDPRLRAAKVWESWQFKTADSPFIPASEIEAARNDLDEKTFKQEYESSFEIMSNRVYYPFDRNIHVRRCVYDPRLPLWIGMDFNIDPMSAIFIQPHAEHLEVIGEMILMNSSTQEMSERLDKLWYKIQNRVTIYPDPAGGGRGHTRGESDFKILVDHGFKRLKYRRKHAMVRDRINSVNRMLKAANGSVRLFMDHSCKGLIDSFEQTQYKNGTSEVDKRLGKEHATDAIGYPIDIEFPVRRNRMAGYTI